jgi:molybdate transport system substrate-binding protein
MNNRCSCSILLLSAVLSFGAVTCADSAELKVLTARAIATVLEVVGPQFERETGNKLNVVTGFSPELVKRIDAGEQFDILAAPPPVLDNVIKAGKLKADTRTVLVSSDVGVEVRTGARSSSGSSSSRRSSRRLAWSSSVRYLPRSRSRRHLVARSARIQTLQRRRVPCFNSCGPRRS